MPTLLKPFSVHKELLKRNLRVFTPREFARVFHATPFQTKYFLEAYTKQGLFLRLKRGLYALPDALPSEGEIANLLYRPSYLSFEYALAVYHVLPEMVYAITSATTKPTRTFIAADKRFVYLTIKQEAFTGYIPTARDGRTILLAEPEKAFVDYFYFVALGKKPNNDRLKLATMNLQKIRQYASLYQRPKLDQLIQDMI